MATCLQFLTSIFDTAFSLLQARKPDSAHHEEDSSPHRAPVRFHNSFHVLSHYPFVAIPIMLISVVIMILIPITIIIIVHIIAIIMLVWGGFGPWSSCRFRVLGLGAWHFSHSQNFHHPLNIPYSNPLYNPPLKGLDSGSCVYRPPLSR